MKNHDDSNSPIVLKVEIDCCHDCPKNLKKKFSGIDGVKTVDVYQQMNLVVVTGDINPKILIDIIKRAGKTATCLEDVEKCSNNNIDLDENDDISDEKEKCFSDDGKDRCPENGSFRQKEDNNVKKCYCKKMNKEDDHTSENVELPRFEEIDKDICQDKYCRIHKRDNNGVQSGFDRPPTNWNLPPGGFGRGYYPFRNYSSEQPRWFREPPLRAPYGYPSLSLPPPGYGGGGIRSSRAPFRNVYSGDFYEANRG